jgi:uncharacterized protein (TIRG00374 family)
MADKPSVAEPPGAAEPKKTPILKYGLLVVTIAGVAIAGAKYLNGEEVWNGIKSFRLALAPLLLALGASYLALKAWRFVFLMRPVTDLPASILFRGFIAGQAATLVPGGVAARAGLMSQVGVPVAKSSGPVALSSLLDQVVFVISSLVAAYFFEGARRPMLVILGVLAALALALGLPQTRAWLARAAAWLAARFKVEAEWRSFLATLPALLAPRQLAITLAITVVCFALKIVALDVSLRGIGVYVGYPVLFLAYVLPTMLGRISVLPAGVGVTEAGMVGFLASAAGLDPNLAAAGTAVFRMATVFWEALLGALVYLFAWKGEKELVGRQPAKGGARVFQPEEGST